MDLHDWLLRTRLIAREEYREIVAAQVEGSLSGAQVDDQGFLSVQHEFEELPLFRKHPIGDVMNAMPLAQEVYDRARVPNLVTLVEKWQEWHVEHLEPICNYSTTSRFGRNLFATQVEKKLVGWFVTNARVRRGSIIKNGDTVVIPEGSSAFYVGFAIAAWRKGASIITSNGPFYSEYLNNPVLAASFRDFHVIGGLADLDRDRRLAEHGGVFGPDCEDAYKRAIQERPAATIVILPVSGLLPDDGPYATTGQVRGLKLSIIRNSLEAQVRELVFIADFTKHLPDNVDSYGTPIMPRRTWQETLTRHSGRISLVTAPPPKLRQALAQSKAMHPAGRTSLDLLAPAAEFTGIDQTYNAVACKLGALFHENGRLMFHEVDSPNDRIARELDISTVRTHH